MADGRPRVSIALVHYPVRGRRGEVTATSLTPLNVHDLARVARTYDLEQVWVVTPLPSQQALLARIGLHWSTGPGREYNPSRREALELVRPAANLNEVIGEAAAGGVMPKLVATGARGHAKGIGFAALRRDIWTGEEPYLLLFGTGWGLTPEIMEECDRILEPIAGRAGYNHLPVREAAAIIIDRLLGAHEAPDGTVLATDEGKER
jgi:hypothetical protein